MSISHWGMFDVPPPLLMIVPPDFKLSEEDLAALQRPGQIIMMDQSQFELEPTKYRRVISL